MNNLKVSYFGKRKGIKVGFIISLCLCAIVVVCFFVFVVVFVFSVIDMYQSYEYPLVGVSGEYFEEIDGEYFEEIQRELWLVLLATVYGVLLIIVLFFIKKNKFFCSLITTLLAFISNLIFFTIASELYFELANTHYIQYVNSRVYFTLTLLGFVFGILTVVCMAIAALLISFRYRNLVLILGLLLLMNAPLFFILVDSLYCFFILAINIPASICFLFLWLPIYLDNICICGFRNGKKTQFCGGCGKKLK